MPCGIEWEREAEEKKGAGKTTRPGIIKYNYT